MIDRINKESRLEQKPFKKLENVINELKKSVTFWHETFDNKQKELKKKLEDVEVMTKHSHPTFKKGIEKLDNEILDLKKLEIHDAGNITELKKKYNIIGEKIPETIHKYYTKNKERIEKLFKTVHGIAPDEVDNIQERMKKLEKHDLLLLSTAEEITPLKKEINELKEQQENNYMIIRNLVNGLDILEEEQDALHQAITNETKVNLRIEEVLQDLGEKLIGWQKEKQTDYDKKMFAKSLRITFRKLEKDGGNMVIVRKPQMNRSKLTVDSAVSIPSNINKKLLLEWFDINTGVCLKEIYKIPEPTFGDSIGYKAIIGYIKRLRNRIEEGTYDIKKDSTPPMPEDWKGTWKEDMMFMIEANKEEPTSSKDCKKCNLYGECDHQGAYKKDGKWCYEPKDTNSTPSKPQTWKGEVPLVYANEKKGDFNREKDGGKFVEPVEQAKAESERRSEVSESQETTDSTPSNKWTKKDFKDFKSEDDILLVQPECDIPKKKTKEPTEDKSIPNELMEKIMSYELEPIKKDAENPSPACQTCIKKGETVDYCKVYMSKCKFHNSKPKDTDSKPSECCECGRDLSILMEAWGEGEGYCPMCRGIIKKKPSESCRTCLYKDNFGDNTCGMCKPNSPQSRYKKKETTPSKDFLINVLNKENTKEKLRQIDIIIEDDETPSKKTRSVEGIYTANEIPFDPYDPILKKEPTEDKSIKVDLGIPESLICIKCKGMIDVMEYMARKNNYKNQMCLKCTVQELS